MKKARFYNMKKVVFLSILSGLVAFYSTALGSERLPVLNILTEDWVPYQYEENGKLTGVAVDIMVLLLKKVGSKQGRDDVDLYPWARAYKELQEKKNTVLFSTTRTVEREDMFKWVCPIFENTTYLIGKKSKNIDLQSVEGVKQYRVGTIIDDASELYLRRLGIGSDKMHRNTKSIFNVEKMENGRIDLIVSGWLAFESDAAILGIDPELYEPVYTVATEQICYAFHPDTADGVINMFQQALDDLIADGSVAGVFERYGNPKGD